MTSNPASLFVIAFALLTYKAWQVGITSYWNIPKKFNSSGDILGEARNQHLAKIKQRFLSTWTLPIGCSILAFALTPWWRWEVLDPHNLLHPIILLASGIMTWRAVTMDINLVTGCWHPKYRVLMLLAWVGVWFHPGFLIFLLHTGITWLRSNYHHQHLAIRITIMFLAFLGASPLLYIIRPILDVKEILDTTAPILFLFLCISASHYLLPGIQKLKLGPHLHSWILDNNLHHIVISAHLWGWLGFLPEAKVIRLACRLRPFDRLFQLGTTGIELGAICILFDHRLCLLLLALFIIFQCMVFMLTGILFWQFMAVNVALAWSVWNLPDSIIEVLFGWESGLLAAFILLTLPYRSKVWRPMRLAWWDTPFIGRVHYEVKGASGTWYGLWSPPRDLTQVF